jgi:3-hydroxyethyl bacteriochlorophyllide a dehydrogenase
VHTTQAIVIPEAGRVELREVALTDPGPDDLILRTAYTSISAGTERMLLAGRLPHPMLRFPLVPGYETVGRVVGMGERVPPELEGRWMYVAGARCFADANPAWGGQARTLFCDHKRAVALDGIEPRQGVLLALAATALHGIDLLGLQEGQRALVLGQGPVGQLAARLARAQGAPVTVFDKAPSRLARSAADERVLAQGQPLAESIQRPFDVVIEATGTMAALTAALPLMGDACTILLLGYYETLQIPYMPLFLKQARLLTAREWAPGDLARSRDMLASGALSVADLLTHRLPVTEVAAAYATALDDPHCLKLVLEWDTAGG